MSGYGQSRDREWCARWFRNEELYWLRRNRRERTYPFCVPPRWRRILCSSRRSPHCLLWARSWSSSPPCQVRPRKLSQQIKLWLSNLVLQTAKNVTASGCFPIMEIEVNRNDLKLINYDADQVTNDQMENIVELMREVISNWCYAASGCGLSLLRAA